MTLIHWLNPVSGSFNNASDWSGGVIPGGFDEAILDASGPPFTVTANSTVDVDSLQIASNATLAVTAETLEPALTGTPVSNAGRIELSDGTALETAGTLNNTGAIKLSSAGNATQLALVTENSGDTIALNGGGMITLGDNANNYIADDGGPGSGFWTETL